MAITKNTGLLLNPQNYNQFAGKFNLNPTSTDAASDPLKMIQIYNSMNQSAQGKAAVTQTGQIPNKTLGTDTQFNLTPTDQQNMSALGGSQYNPTSEINAALIQNGQDPFQLDQQNTSSLQDILDIISRQAQSQQTQRNQYLQAFQAAREQSGLPSIEQTIQDINSQIAQRNLAYGTAANTIENQAIPMGIITGQEAALQRQRQTEMANLTAQQQNAMTRYGLAQNQQAAQLAQANLGLGLGTPQYLATVQNLISQGRLQEAQAALAQGQASMYQGFGTGQLTTDANGNIVQTGQQAYGNYTLNTLPTGLQTYASEGPNGTVYIDENRVPTVQKQIVQRFAAQYGVPYLTTEEVGKVRNIDVTQQNLSQLMATSQKILSSGLMGRLRGLTLNQIQNLAQSNPDIAAFKVYRDTAINTIQALAAGTGGGFRLNQTEINTATSNLPEITDNLETAQAKMSLLQGFLSKWEAQILQKSVGAGGGINAGGGSTTGWEW